MKLYVSYILGRAVTLNGSYKDFPGPCESSCTRGDVEGPHYKVHKMKVKKILRIINLIMNSK